MHLVHIKEGTKNEYLVVSVLFDVSEYGFNIEVRVQSCMIIPHQHRLHMLTAYHGPYREHGHRYG